MAYRKYIAALVLGVCALFILSVSHAAKPPKPVDELEGRVTELEADVAGLYAEVSALSETVNELATRPVPPRQVVVDADGNEIGLLLQLAGPDASSGGDLLLKYTPAFTWFNINGEWAILAVYPTFIGNTAMIWFAEPHCTGAAYRSRSAADNERFILTRAKDFGVSPDGQVLMASGPITLGNAVSSHYQVVRNNSSTGSESICTRITPTYVTGVSMNPIGQLPPSTPPYSIEVR